MRSSLLVPGELPNVIMTNTSTVKIADWQAARKNRAATRFAGLAGKYPAPNPRLGKTTQQRTDGFEVTPQRLSIDCQHTASYIDHYVALHDWLPLFPRELL